MALAFSHSSRPQAGWLSSAKVIERDTPAIHVKHLDTDFRLLLSNQKTLGPEAGGHLGMTACSVAGVQFRVIGLTLSLITTVPA